MLKKIEEFKKCIDEHRYYDAHEALEEAWFPRRFEESADVKVLKGFINVAVSFELHKRGRIPQSKKVWTNYLKYRLFLHSLVEYKREFHALSRYVEAIHIKKHH